MTFTPENFTSELRGFIGRQTPTVTSHPLPKLWYHEIFAKGYSFQFFPFRRIVNITNNRGQQQKLQLSTAEDHKLRMQMRAWNAQPPAMMRQPTTMPTGNMPVGAPA